MNGIDSSIIVYSMDPSVQEHLKVKSVILALEEWAINPTVVHEVYHTLVYKRKMRPEDAKTKIRTLIQDRRTRFLNLNRTVSLYSLNLTVQYRMGSRDALITGCYMHYGIEKLLTHDNDLLKLKSINFKGRTIQFTDPLSNNL